MKKIFFVLIFFPLFLTSTYIASAEENNVPFSVSPILPENQTDSNVSYFDIEIVPGATQELEVIVYNSSEESIEVEVTNNFAATNSNGLVTYDGSIERFDNTMEYPFNEISKIENNTLQIEAGEQETAVISLSAPKKSFDGNILGGIHIIQKIDETDHEGGVALINQYAYAIAVKISEKNNSTEVEPMIELNGVEPGIVNHRTSLQTEFANKTATIIQDLTFVGEVFSEESDEAMYTRTQEDFTIAPNVLFNFPIMYENQPLKPGNYVFKANVSNEDHSWDFEQEFEVTDEVADEVNEAAVELEEEENNWLIYLVIGLTAIVLVLLIVLLLVLRRKK